MQIRIFGKHNAQLTYETPMGMNGMDAVLAFNTNGKVDVYIASPEWVGNFMLGQASEKPALMELNATSGKKEFFLPPKQGGQGSIDWILLFINNGDEEIWVNYDIKW